MQQHLRQTHVRTHHDGQVLVVFFIDGVRNVGLFDVNHLGPLLHFHSLGDFTNLEGNVLPIDRTAGYRNPGSQKGLKALLFHLYSVRAEDERGRGEVAVTRRGDDGVAVSGLIGDRYGGLWNSPT